MSLLFPFPFPFPFWYTQVSDDTRFGEMMTWTRLNYLVWFMGYLVGWKKESFLKLLLIPLVLDHGFYSVHHGLMDYG